MGLFSFLKKKKKNRKAAELYKIQENKDMDLYWAANNGSEMSAKNHLKNGANANASTMYGTPLMAAVAGGHKKIIELLLDNGADINATFQGKTALDIALINGVFTVSDKLKKAGALSGKDIKEMTSVRLASDKEVDDILLYWAKASPIVKEVISMMGKTDGSLSMLSKNKELFGKINKMAEGNIVTFIMLTRVNQIMENFNSANKPLEAMTRAMNILDGMPAYGETVSIWRMLISDSISMDAYELLNHSRKLEETIRDGAGFMFFSAKKFQEKNL